MKHLALCLAVLGVAAVLGGCPVYSSSSDYRVCNDTGCFDCPDPSYSGMCVTWSCSSDSDCAGTLTCINSQCSPPGTQPSPPASDCSLSGCPSGQVCRLAGGVASCAPLPGLPGEDASAPSADATTPLDAATFAFDSAGDVQPAPNARDASGDAPADAIGANDAADAAVLSDSPAEGASAPDAGAPIPCNADGDCALGAACIDGQCTPKSQLCSDGSQCAASGDACVNGLCVPHCSSGAPCPSGYACNFTLGVCSVNPGPCAGSGTSSCLGGAVCVESHCVPPCGVAEGGATCAAGQACVNDGCIPDEKALFSCKNDGTSGQLANTCDPASVCLHHDCYVACDGDGGGCAASACKQVTVKAGTYAVCATATTLGSDCDLAAGAACPGSGTCVDGYCR